MNLKSLKSRVTNAFSLIELMVVIAIVALLTAIAVPSYQSYLTQAKVTEVFSLASDLMNQWATNYNMGTTFGVTNTNNLGSYVDATYIGVPNGTAPSGFDTKCTTSGMTGGTGLGAVCILLTTATPHPIDNTLSGLTIVFTPKTQGSSSDTANVHIDWTCNYPTTASNNTTITSLLSPGNCTPL